jgi:DNA helicase-2/ATP-dependent DNA helicase PcrA
VVDFGELMLPYLRCCAITIRFGALSAPFRHILIDEFQDTNKLQYAWIKMLAGTGAMVRWTIRPTSSPVAACWRWVT